MLELVGVDYITAVENNCTMGWTRWWRTYDPPNTVDEMFELMDEMTDVSGELDEWFISAPC